MLIPAFLIRLYVFLFHKQWFYCCCCLPFKLLFDAVYCIVNGVMKNWLPSQHRVISFWYLIFLTWNLPFRIYNFFCRVVADCFFFTIFAFKLFLLFYLSFSLSLLDRSLPLVWIWMWIWTTYIIKINTNT